MFEKRAGGNQALNVNGNTVNGATADIAITVRGSDWVSQITSLCYVCIPNLRESIGQYALL